MPDYPGSFTIECASSSCNCGMIHDTREQVIAAWNRRPAPTSFLRVRQQLETEWVVLRSMQDALRRAAAALVANDGPSASEPKQERLMTSGFYVASRASIPERSAMWRMYRDAGVPITASWIDEAGEGETGDYGELWARIQREIVASSALVLYAELDDFPLKGAYIEAGMAIALGKPVFIVCPDVELSARDAKPVGSWVKHPAVQFIRSVDEAFAAARVMLAANPAQPVASSDCRKYCQLEADQIDAVRDAGRYRFIRRADHDWCVVAPHGNDAFVLSETELDGAIDAAIAATQG